MKTFLLISIVLIIYHCSGCVAAKEGSTRKNSLEQMHIKEEKDIVSLKKIRPQEIPSLASRGLDDRGIISLSNITGSLISLGVNTVKKMIANEKGKYMASYPFSLSDLYFYDQLSTESPFDPVGMQFYGFTLVRTFKNKTGGTDTAFKATFLLDTTNINEIINNSVFRLKLKEFRLYYAKAKVPASAKAKKLNMDFEIIFNTSYVNSSGNLFDNVTLGKFYFSVRNAPLDQKAPGYQAYYDSLPSRSRIIGRSFIVPRSFGYHLSGGSVEKSWSQGAYSIIVNVKESSKDVFVNRILLDNAGSFLESNEKNIQKVINEKLLPDDLR
jgi:hypothetical protein